MTNNYHFIFVFSCFCNFLQGLGFFAFVLFSRHQLQLKTGHNLTPHVILLAQVDVTVVERHEIAGQASGKAGGFLALDWNDGGPVGNLARRSFQLHDQVSALGLWNAHLFD